MMTCAQVADIFEARVARCSKRGTDGEPVAMRFRQMKRFVPRLREHADEERFGEDMRKLLPDLNSLDLMLIELCMIHWWGPVDTPG